MRIAATCALGLEGLLDAELAALSQVERRIDRGAVEFEGSWEDVYRACLHLRTANRVLVELHRWSAATPERLAAGAAAAVATRADELFDPGATISVRASSSDSAIRDVRFAALKVKDGIVDAQRLRFGRRASVARSGAELAFRLRLHRDEATLFLDAAGESLDRRGYRRETVTAPLRETLAAAMVLASDWDGRGPVLDPMCGSGTLLAEAGAIARGLPAGRLRQRWAFEHLPGFDPAVWKRVREPVSMIDASDLFGRDRDPQAIRAARANLTAAGLVAVSHLEVGEGLIAAPPPGPGLVVVNPPHGERLVDSPEGWRAIGDYLKRQCAGWRAAVFAGGDSRGKWLGLRPKRRIPVWNGPLEARILIFEIY